MTFEDVFVLAIVGMVAGWLAGVVIKGRGYGLVGDVVLGAAGSILGGALFGPVGLAPHGHPGRLAVASVGAVVLAGAVRLLLRRPVPASR